MPTPVVDLIAINPLVEILVRGGDALARDARYILQQAYIRVDRVRYPDAPGVSCLFRAGATLDELAHEGQFPNAKLSYAGVGALQQELLQVGYDLVLFVTPDPDTPLPDHHSLAVAKDGQVVWSLPGEAADALIRVLIVVDNAYRTPRSRP